MQLHLMQCYYYIQNFRRLQAVTACQELHGRHINLSSCLPFYQSHCLWSAILSCRSSCSYQRNHFGDHMLIFCLGCLILCRQAISSRFRGLQDRICIYQKWSYFSFSQLQLQGQMKASKSMPPSFLILL